MVVNFYSNAKDFSFQMEFDNKVRIIISSNLKYVFLC